MTDEPLVAAIQQLANRIPGIRLGALEWRILGGNDLNSTPLEERGKSGLLAEILVQGGEILRWAQLQFRVPGQPDQGSIAFSRQNSGIVDVSLNLPNVFDGNPEVKTQVAVAFHQVFHKYARSHILDQIHPLLSDFYNRREEILRRLEELQARLVSDAAAARQKIEEDVQQQYASKAAEIAKAAQDLEALRKQFDDRDYMHARREQHDALMTAAQEHNSGPWPAPATERQRLPVKLAFVLLAVSAVALAAWAAYRSFQPAATEPFWFPFVRLGVSLALLAGTVVLYVRWQDRWAVLHAQEEQRRGQLQTEIDWANWLVEVMLEWHATHGTDLPRELLEKLPSRGGPAEKIENAEKPLLDQLPQKGPARAAGA